MTHHIPQRIKEGLDRYANEGIPTGDFLRALLENDLMKAIHHADRKSSFCFWEICDYIYNELPANCHGSPQIVQAWIEKHRLVRLDKLQMELTEGFESVKSASGN